MLETLNLDGTIRENKLFRGESIAKAEEKIDIIKDYESLDAFLKSKKEWCNQMKKRNKEYYQNMLAKRGTESISPYLDDEIMRIIKRKR